MATETAVRSVTNTLSGTTADTITLSQPWGAIEVSNLDTVNWLYVRQDGVTAVGSANEASPVAPGTSKVLSASMNSSGQHVISIVGNGGAYVLEGVA